MAPPKKYYWTPEEDNLLRRKYNHYPRTIDEIQRLLPHYPRQTIRERARFLGLAWTREPLWTGREELLLEQWLPRYALETIAKKFGRSLTAVARKGYRLGITKTKLGYTRAGVAHGLGCDPQTVGKWICSGKLRAIRRQTRRLPTQHGDIWFIDPVELRDFIKRHPDEVSFRTADKRFLIAVLTTEVSPIECTTTPEQYSASSSDIVSLRGKQFRRAHSNGRRNAHIPTSTGCR